MGRVSIEPAKIGVVVSTYNRPKSLIRLLDILSDQRRIDLANKVSACVVDDGSDIDLSNILLDYPFDLSYIYRPRAYGDIPRVYSSRNMAALVAGNDCDVILQLDDDLVFHKRLLSEIQNLVALYDAPHWAWIARLSDNKDIVRGEGYQRGRDGRWYDGAVRWLPAKYTDGSSAGLLMPMRTWVALGGYDEEYDGSMGAADQDLLLRVQKLGGTLMLAPYFFNIDDSESESWRMPMIERAVARGRERNEVIFGRKHPDAQEWTSV